MDKIKLAFDLDGIIIGKPPLIPKRVLEYLFRGRADANTLRYRYPKTRLEIWIRKLSHYHLFRPPIKKNIEFIRQLAGDPRYELYVISARYSFLEQETYLWLKKRKVGQLFKRVYLNLKDEQPHLFKEKVLKDLKPTKFVDDDHLLADYLVESQVPALVYCLPAAKGAVCRQAKSLPAGLAGMV